MQTFFKGGMKGVKGGGGTEPGTSSDDYVTLTQAALLTTTACDQKPVLSPLWYCRLRRLSVWKASIRFTECMLLWQHVW